MKVTRGHIWSVALDPTVANEQRGTRPCLVVSADRFNALPIRQAIVVPLTTRDRGLPHHVPVRDDGGLSRGSWAMCEGVRTVSTQRFVQLIGTAEQVTIDAVLDQLARWLALHAVHRGGRLEPDTAHVPGLEMFISRDSATVGPSFTILAHTATLTDVRGRQRHALVATLRYTDMRSAELRTLTLRCGPAGRPGPAPRCCWPTRTPSSPRRGTASDRRRWRARPSWPGSAPAYPGSTTRTSGATELLAGGADLQVVKERLGHRSIAAAEKYLHTLPDANETALAALDRVRTKPRAV